MSGNYGVFPAIFGLAVSYNNKPFLSGENKRLNLPGIRFTDGPRWVVMKHGTTFPVTAARARHWGSRPGRAHWGSHGDGGAAPGSQPGRRGGALTCCATRLGGAVKRPTGEDPYHLGEMGAALVRGLQRHVMACVKHFACNSIEDTRMKEMFASASVPSVKFTCRTSSAASTKAQPV